MPPKPYTSRPARYDELTDCRQQPPGGRRPKVAYDRTHTLSRVACAELHMQLRVLMHHLRREPLARTFDHGAPPSYFIHSQHTNTNTQHTNTYNANSSTYFTLNRDWTFTRLLQYGG